LFGYGFILAVSCIDKNRNGDSSKVHKTADVIIGSDDCWRLFASVQPARNACAGNRNASNERKKKKEKKYTEKGTAGGGPKAIPARAKLGIVRELPDRFRVESPPLYNRYSLYSRSLAS